LVGGAEAGDGQLRVFCHAWVAGEVDGAGGAVLVDKAYGIGDGQGCERGGCKEDGAKELHFDFDGFLCWLEVGRIVGMKERVFSQVGRSG